MSLGRKQIMKVATPRKNILKTERDLKPPPSNGLKSAMVATRTSAIKESFVPRTSSQRYAELPSLRYGATPTPTAAQMIGSGPLRVNTNFENSGRRNILRYKRCSSYEGTATSLDGFSNYGTESRNYEHVSEEAPQVVRRVRFAELPPKCNHFTENGDEKEKDEEGEEEEEEGTENWMRNRMGIPCIDGNSVSSSARFARHGLTSSASFPTSVKLDNFRLGNGGAIQGGTVLTNPNARKHVPRGHDTARYRKGTLTQSSNPVSGGPPPLLRAAKDGTEEELVEILRKAALHGISQDDLNAADSSGRTAVSYIASGGSLPNLESILQLQGVDVNKADNEGNTPLHFAAQAGQVEAVNYMLSRCVGLEVDARNALGFTPLMKAALQGRTKCAKLLLFAGLPSFQGHHPH